MVFSNTECSALLHHDVAGTNNDTRPRTNANNNNSRIPCSYGGINSMTTTKTTATTTVDSIVCNDMVVNSSSNHTPINDDSVDNQSQTPMSLSSSKSTPQLVKVEYSNSPINLSHVESLLSFGGGSQADDDDNDSNHSRYDINSSSNNNKRNHDGYSNQYGTHCQVLYDDEEAINDTTRITNSTGFFLSPTSIHNVMKRTSSRSSQYYNYFSNRPSMRAKTAKELWPKIDSSAVFFGLRMAIVLTIAGSFVITPNNQYPQGMWVLISALFVCWFPSMDAGSVVEKCGQRMIGTIIGASMGVSCGMISLLIVDEEHDIYYQYIFLSSCMFIVNFFIVFLSGQCKVGNEKVINKFSYATILCVLTFCISLTPFACTSTTIAATITSTGNSIRTSDMDSITAAPPPTTTTTILHHTSYDRYGSQQWMPGIIRVGNVLIGCVLGALASIAICPKSTTDVLYEKTARQVRLAGEASDALMQTASEYFSGRNSMMKIQRLTDTILRQPLESSMKWKLRRQSSGCSDDGSLSTPSKTAQLAVRKYEDAIMDWRATKALFPLAMYDPFATYDLTANGKTKAMLIQTDIAQALARALRIQTTIVVMDGMIRNEADYDFTQEQTMLFGQIGVLIRRMLTVPLNISQTNHAASELFTKLEQIRHCILYVSAHVAAATDDSATTNTVHDGYSTTGVRTFKDSILSNEIEDVFGDSSNTDDDEGRGVLKHATSKHDNTLFFLQLVEHLILRSLRLYQAWKHVEIKASM